MKTSWEKSARWYDSLVGKEGHFFHKEIILPKLKEYFKKDPPQKILDIGCGQGILSQHIPKECKYVGIDASKQLIEFAKKQQKKDQMFYEMDACQNELPLESDFSHAYFILSLQNMEKASQAVLNAAKALKNGGSLIFVLNHPCFRIPRQSSWIEDENKKLMMRCMYLYHSFLKIPIDMHPGENKKTHTWSFHYNLEEIFRFLSSANCVVEHLEEWYSPKTSTGKKGKMENRARKEFPLFLMIRAKKQIP